MGLNNKLYQCKEEGCENKQPILSKGYCNFHKNKQLSPKMKHYIAKSTSKNRLKKKEKSELMRPFWEFHLENVEKNPFCENCGCKIQGNINNLAHILPKRNFGGNPEVSNHPSNCIYLCASINGGEETGCHDRFDKISATTKVYLMNCWEKCVNKYLTFRQLCKYNKYVENLEQWIKENEEKRLGNSILKNLHKLK